MAEPKPFYEIEIPKRILYTIVIKPEKDLNYCAEPDCTNDADQYGDTQFDEVYQCDCCGQWFCIDHITEMDYCTACKKLPLGIQEKVRTFRMELNS